MGFTLNITKGPAAGQTLRFDQGVVSFGRTDDNDVVLYDPNVSRNHFSISDENGTFVLRDLGSSNGTVVNGTKVSEHDLSDGDQVEVGDAVFVFGGGGASAGLEKSGPPARQRQGSGGRAPARQRPRAAAPAAPRGRQAAPPARRSQPAAPPSSARDRLRQQRQAESLGGRIAALDTKKKAALFGIPGVLLLLIVLKVAMGSGGGGMLGEEDYSDTTLEAVGDVTRAAFGLDVPDVVLARYQMKFTFRYTDGRATLYYEAGWIDTDQEVEIRLNEDRIVGYAPMAIKSWSDRREIVLPMDALIQNDFNTVTFDNTANPGAGPLQDWAVRNVRIREDPLPEPDAVIANEKFQVGVKLWEQLLIGPRNLYAACQNFKLARDYLERMPAKPPLYDEASARIKQCNVKLQEQWESLNFAAQKEIKFEQYKEAKMIYQDMLLYFPDEGDWRHQQILAMLSQFR